MSGVTTFRVGRLVVHALEGGIQKLDGGAMFGVVPKPLWERRIAPDSRNRIPLAMRCLLVEHDDGLVLVDTALGNKDTAKFRDIYGIENLGADGRTTLDESLAHAGAPTGRYHDGPQYAPALRSCRRRHLDRARTTARAVPRSPTRMPSTWCTAARSSGPRIPTSARRRATCSTISCRCSRRDGSGCSRVSSETVLPGIGVIVTPGHIPWHMAVLIESEGEALLFPGDTIPTAHHLPLPWIMGYDVEPLRTLESKRALYARGAVEGWRVVFEHDAETVGGRLVAGERGVELAEVVRSDER